MRGAIGLQILAEQTLHHAKAETLSHENWTTLAATAKSVNRRHVHWSSVVAAGTQAHLA